MQEKVNYLEVVAALGSTLFHNFLENSSLITLGRPRP